jgi:Fur family transcriptional regulator, ferric uptake regulator
MKASPERRMTRQRKVILAELRGTDSHPTADEIYECVRGKLPRISLGTVYRNLQTLVSDGRIRTLSDGSRMRYDGALDDHCHVRCAVCGVVGDVPAREIGGQPCQGENFRILGYKIEFVGICPECELEGKEADIGIEDMGDYRPLSPA